MALFIIVFFYLPILLFPLAFITAIVACVSKFSLLRLGVLLTLLPLCYLWYKYAGSEIIDPEIARWTSPKIKVELEGDKAVPRMIAILVTVEPSADSTDRILTIDSNGFSQPDFQWPDHNLREYQFNFQNLPPGFSLVYRSSEKGKLMFVFYRSDLDHSSPLGQKINYIGGSPELFLIRKKSGRSLEEITLELTDFDL